MSHQFINKTITTVLLFLAISFSVNAQNNQSHMMNMQGMKNGHMMDMQKMITYMNQMNTQMNSMIQQMNQDMGQMQH